MDYLYHGSTTEGIKTLEPRKRYTPSDAIDFPAIYATPLQAYAAAHSFPWSSNEGFDLDVVDGKVLMTAPASLKDRLAVPVSIYKVKAEKFAHTDTEETGQTWHALEPVEIIEEARWPSVEEAIIGNGGVVRYK